MGKRRCVPTLSEHGQEAACSRWRLDLVVDFKKQTAHKTSPLARSGMVEAARLQTPRRRADAAVRRPASRGSKGQRRGPTKLCIRALLRASAPIISRMTEMGLTKSFSHRGTMADRALGALAAAFGSAAVEGRLLRAGVIIRKGPHRDGAPETHRHPGPDRTSWARTKGGYGDF